MLISGWLQSRLLARASGDKAPKATWLPKGLPPKPIFPTL